MVWAIFSAPVVTSLIRVIVIVGKRFAIFFTQTVDPCPHLAGVGARKVIAW